MRLRVDAEDRPLLTRPSPSLHLPSPHLPSLRDHTDVPLRPLSAPLSIDEALAAADANGWFHRSVCVAVLLACFCGGMGGGVAPFLLSPVAAEADFSPWELAWLACSQFVGMWVGSLAGGLLCDACGPGRTMASSLPPLAAGSLLPLLQALPLSLSQLSPSSPLSLLSPFSRVSPFLLLLIGGRLCVGASIVICFQAANTYVAETCPTPLRGLYMSLLHIGIATGGLASCALALTLPAEQWRLLLFFNAIPTLLAASPLLLFACRRESPREVGNLHAGKRKAEVVGFVSRLRTLLHSSLRRNLGLGMVVAFMLVRNEPHTPLPSPFNFGHKGAEAWTASYIERLNQPQLARLSGMATMLGKVAGDLISSHRISANLGRIRMLRWSFVACAGLLLLFVRLSSAILVTCIMFAFGLFSDIIWCNIYMLLAELFPTSIRSSAFGIVLCIGRSGGVFSSALGGLVPDMKALFCLFAASFACGGLMVGLLPDDTSRLPLPDTL
ncbi:MAG: hypothetical protein SGPRY_001203 [Prymnesium sp.]